MLDMRPSSGQCWRRLDRGYGKIARRSSHVRLARGPSTSDSHRPAKPSADDGVLDRVAIIPRGVNLTQPFPIASGRLLLDGNVRWFLASRSPRYESMRRLFDVEALELDELFKAKLAQRLSLARVLPTRPS